MRPKINLADALTAYGISDNTRRAYYRWLDAYLVAVGGVSATRGAARLARMRALSPTLLNKVLHASKFKAWLDTLAAQGVKRQNLDQARAAVVTVSELLAEMGALHAETAANLKRVRTPHVPKLPTQERVLTPQELELLVKTAAAIATTPNQQRRNIAALQLLTTLGLRREELSKLTWGDIQLKEQRVCVVVGEHSLELNRATLAAIDRWRTCFEGSTAKPTPESPLLRRIWKGGRIGHERLSPDGVWLIVSEAAQAARLGVVTPDDLRRSLAMAHLTNGMSLENLSRLLRHRHVFITEKFVARLLSNEDKDA